MRLVALKLTSFVLIKFHNKFNSYLIDRCLQSSLAVISIPTTTHCDSGAAHLTVIWINLLILMVRVTWTIDNSLYRNQRYSSTFISNEEYMKKVPKLHRYISIINYFLNFDPQFNHYSYICQEAESVKRIPMDNW